MALVREDVVAAGFSVSGNKNADAVGISIFLEFCCGGFMLDVKDFKRGCSDIGCLRMVSGLALIGRLSLIFNVCIPSVLDCTSELET